MVRGSCPCLETYGENTKPSSIIGYRIKKRGYPLLSNTGFVKRTINALLAYYHSPPFPCRHPCNSSSISFTIFSSDLGPSHSTHNVTIAKKVNTSAAMTAGICT